MPANNSITNYNFHKHTQLCLPKGILKCSQTATWGPPPFHRKRPFLLYSVKSFYLEIGELCRQRTNKKKHTKKILSDLNLLIIKAHFSHHPWEHEKLQLFAEPLTVIHSLQKQQQFTDILLILFVGFLEARTISVHPQKSPYSHIPIKICFEQLLYMFLPHIELKEVAWITGNNFQPDHAAFVIKIILIKTCHGSQHLTENEHFNLRKEQPLKTLLLPLLNAGILYFSVNTGGFKILDTFANWLNA